MTPSVATVSAYCASCGEDVEADAQTGRCPTCGKLSTTHLPTRSLSEIRHDAGVGMERKSPSAAYRAPFNPASSVAEPPAAAIVPAPSPPDLTRFRLPSSAPTRKWLETTRALLAGFTSAAADAEDKAAALEAKIADQVHELKAEAVRFRNSARVITQMLEQLGLEAEEAPVRPGIGRPLPAGQWSRKHERCIDCGRTDRQHKALGRCSTCEAAHRTAENKARGS